MKLVIVTDAWHPQVNGVVRTLERTREELVKLGHEVAVVSPQCFFTVPCPTYPEIRLSVATKYDIAVEIKKYAPDHIHIATEAMLGMAARSYCRSHGLNFTTSYHTRFPEYLSARVPIPLHWSYAYLRRFHNSGIGCMVATQTLEQDLKSKGFKNLKRWSRGVDTDVFKPERRIDHGFEGPVQLYVGRVAVEKNIEEFLQTNVPGTKIIVGDGPARLELSKRFPDAKFLGVKTGDELADIYACADVFVFPSRTDTFGIVLLEALASGVPVAAHPVMGPIDVVGEHHEIGVLNNDLNDAIRGALKGDRNACRNFALQRSWTKTAELFIDNIETSRTTRFSSLAV